MTGSGVSQPPWETERHRRGMLRWYPFGSAMVNGLSSAGSTVQIIQPGIQLFTGALAASPSSKGKEQAERVSNTFNTNPFSGIDGLGYWGRPMRITAFMGVGSGQVVPIGGRIYAGIFLQAPGVPPWSTTPAIPYAILRYARNALLDAAPDERFELVTAKGDGTAQTVTRLTNVLGPKSDASVGGCKFQRLELIYVPNGQVIAVVDGVVGASESVTIPLAATNPTNNTLGGVGVWIENGNAGDAARAEFAATMMEHYRA